MPHVLVRADDCHVVEAAELVDEQSSVFGRGRVVRGAPRPRRARP